MINKKWIALIVVCVLNIAVSVTALVLHFTLHNNKLSATEIYNECLYNVVEVKAQSDNVGESFGTGEIISENGQIVTNAHVVTYSRLGVINEFENYYIRFAFEDEYRPVTLEKYNTDLDLAVLNLNDFSDLSLKPVKLGDSGNVQSGESVYAVGNASNYGIGIFTGIISIPLINVELDGLTRIVIQCDLTIAAGNSGGALLNDKGELIGLTTFRTKDTSGNVIFGIVYCIPVNVVLEYTNE